MIVSFSFYTKAVVTQALVCGLPDVMYTLSSSLGVNIRRTTCACVTVIIISRCVVYVYVDIAK